MSRTFLSESPYFQNNKSERFSRLRTLRSCIKRLMGGFSQTLKFKPVTLDFDAREPGTIKATNFAKEKSASTLQPLFSAKKKLSGLSIPNFLSFVPGLQIIGTQKSCYTTLALLCFACNDPGRTFELLITVDYSSSLKIGSPAFFSRNRFEWSRNRFGRKLQLLILTFCSQVTVTEIRQAWAPGQQLKPCKVSRLKAS